eukprot:1405376-Amphidinium_carterae.1
MADQRSDDHSEPRIRSDQIRRSEFRGSFKCDQIGSQNVMYVIVQRIVGKAMWTKIGAFWFHSQSKSYQLSPLRPRCEKKIDEFAH